MGRLSGTDRDYSVEIDSCVRCGGRLGIIASIERLAVIAKILTHLEGTAPGPRLARVAARARPPLEPARRSTAARSASRSPRSTGSFVKGVLHDPIDREMVRSINEIGHLTGKQTIAEWAENAEIIEVLRGLGVDYAQGYGVSQPQKVQRAAIA